MTKTRKPKIMFWDLETSHVEAKVWSLFKPMINPSDIINDWFLLCGAWKFLGEDEIFTASCTRRELLARNDKRIVSIIRKAVEEADLIVAHNGDAFDTKKLKARIIKHGLEPLSFVKSIDTLKVARKEFKFTSNRLDAIGAFLGVGRKISNPPGLWDNVEAGSMEHMEMMLDYNKQDVVLLEEVYLRLRPHMQNHPNINLFAPVVKGEVVCNACTSTNSRKYGFTFSNTRKYQKHQCMDCGSIFKGSIIKKGE